MNELIISKRGFAVPFLVATAIVLMGAGCSGGSSTGSSSDLPSGFVQIPTEAGASSSFAGEDGATTEATFDALSAGYNTYLADEGYAGGTNYTFGLYLNTVTGATTDASGNEISLYEIDLDNYQLRSNGADTFPNTEDDHYKSYTD